MSETDLEVLVTEFRADFRRYEAQLRRNLNATERRNRELERKWAQSNDRIVRNQQQTDERLRRLLSVAALTLAGRQILAYERQWRDLTNTMRQYEDVLGPATASTSRLNQVANDAGVSVGQLGPLIGAASRAARDLGGKGADDVIGFGEAFSKGAALANTGQAAVAGAATQLSQAIASPRVHLQEFNSVVEGTPRLAQAFADGIDEAGGSVARLRQLIASGEVSGGVLFTALLTQLPRIRREFETLQQGPEQALARLQNRLAEFVGTNEHAVSGARRFAAAIDFLSENLDAFADVVVVAGAALAGYFGARAAVAITAGLVRQAAGFAALQAQIATVAFFSGRAAAGMAALRASTAFLGGPVVAGVTIVATGLALLAQRSGEAQASFASFDRTLADYNKTLAAGEGDAAKLARLEELLGKNEDITEALKAQGIASREAALTEIDSLRARIRENAELLALYKDQLRFQIAALEEGQRAAQRNLSSIREEERERRLAARRAAARSGLRPGEAAPTAPLADAIVAQRFEAQREALNRKIEAGVALTAEERKLRDEILEIAAREIELAEKRRLLAELGQPVESGGGGGAIAGLSEDDLEANARLVAELEKAYNSLFDTELQGIERVRRERLAAIDASALGELDKARERVRVNAIADEEIIALKRAAAEEEIDLVNNAVEARDRALGRTIAIAEREYEARRAAIEREIQDAERRNIALAALEEERQAFLNEARAALPGGPARPEAEGFFARETDETRARAAEQLQALQEAFEQRLIAEEEFEARRREVIRASEEEIQDIRRRGIAATLSITSDAFGTLGDVARKYVGEQSAAFQALFAISKAFAVAESVVKIQAALANALVAPFPQNLVNYAQVAALGAQIISTAAGANFAGGGEVSGPGTGTSDSIPATIDGRAPARLSNGEFVVNAEATRKNLAALKAINAGHFPRGFAASQFRGFAAGGMVGAPGRIENIIQPPDFSRVLGSRSGDAAAAPAASAAPAPVNVKVINASDMRQAMAEYVASPEGETAVLNVIGRNRSKANAQLGNGRR